MARCRTVFFPEKKLRCSRGQVDPCGRPKQKRKKFFVRGRNENEKGPSFSSTKTRQNENENGFGFCFGRPQGST
jgi:hypothetical protein